MPPSSFPHPRGCLWEASYPTDSARRGRTPPSPALSGLSACPSSAIFPVAPSLGLTAPSSDAFPFSSAWVCSTPHRCRPLLQMSWSSPSLSPPSLLSFWPPQQRHSTCPSPHSLAPTCLSEARNPPHRHMYFNLMKVRLPEALYHVSPASCAPLCWVFLAFRAKNFSAGPLPEGLGPSWAGHSAICSSSYLQEPQSSGSW